MMRLEKWFNEERAHRHEVRCRTILTRLKFEMEFERDKQLVLQQQGSEKYMPFTHEACSARLQTFAINCQVKRQQDWVEKVVYPRIGAGAPRLGRS